MYGLLISIILVRTCCDLSFKMAVNKLQINSFANLIKHARTVIFNPFLWLGLIFGSANVVLWLLVLNRFDLHYAYPFTSICYVIIILAGKLFFKEHIDGRKVLGMVSIAIGIVFLSLGHH